MDEIGIEHRQLGMILDGPQQIGAHGDDGRGAAGRHIEPPDQLLAARLGSLVQQRCRIIIVGIGVQLDEERPHLVPVGAVAFRQVPEEGDALLMGQRPVGREDVGRQHHPRSLAQAGIERIAHSRQVRGRGRRAVLARHQGAPLLGDGGDQLVEEGDAHCISWPIIRFGSQVAISGTKQRMTMAVTMHRT